MDVYWKYIPKWKITIWYVCERKFWLENVASTYQTVKWQNGMYFCGGSEGKIARNTYQSEKVRVGMYIREVFCLQNVANTYQNEKVQFGM